MERYHDQIFHKVINLESRLFFVEKYLHIVDDYSSALQDKILEKSVKIIIEKQHFTEIIHPSELNCKPLIKYLDDPFFDIFFVRIYIHGSDTVHEENVVTIQSGYYNHYYVRKLYSVYILSRHCLISNDYSREPLLNTDPTKTTNISLYSDVDKRLAFFFGYCTGGDIPPNNIRYRRVIWPPQLIWPLLTISRSKLISG